MSLICLPEGRLLPAGSPDQNPDAQPAGVAPLLLNFAAQPATDAPSDPPLAWLHRFSHLWMAQVCRTLTPQPPPPRGPDPEKADSFFDSILQEAPPFPGAEYLTVESLATLWTEAGALLADSLSTHPDGLSRYLRNTAPGWHLVGRVTFHLAENKRDPDKPFAFLATYTDALNASGKPQHIPLGRALQTYAAARDSQTLETILAPVRTAADTIPWVRELLESRRVFQALAWSPTEAYRFIQSLPAMESAGLILKVPDWWKSGRPSRPAVQVTLDAQESALGIGAMLRFQISTTLDGEPLSDEDWDRIKNSSSGLINLRGQWVEIDRAKLGEVLDHWHKVADAHSSGNLSFHEGMRFLAGFPPGGPGAPAAEFTDSLTDWTQVIAGKNLAALLHQLRHPGTPMPSSGGKKDSLEKALLPPAPPAPPVRASLRPYQLQGLAWLTFMRHLGLGACLADDMGLGKTLQVIALLATLEKQNPWPAPNARRPDSAPQPFLLVVPASLLGNWLAEFEKFAPSLRVFAAHASRTPRDRLDNALAHPREILSGHHAVLTTYGLIQRSPSLQSHPWQAVILDEAQAIKNAGTAQARAIKKLQATWRLALTGTPIENRPGDLWSLFDFLNPGLLGSASAFASLLKTLTDPSSAAPRGYAPLRRLIQPYILRRMKTDKSIIADLPDKTEVTATCTLSRKQAIIYGKLVEQLKKDLADPFLDPMARRSLVVGYLIKFKQVCNHSSHWSGDGVYAPADSGKFDRLAELCHDIADRQERVLIFTQFREIIDPLHAFLTTVFKRPGLVLHGGTAVTARQKLVDQFQTPGGPPFFILSVKAGGTGLTLTAASHVIHFDRWWNPAVENQATDRAYRIGQKRNVLVHKFVTTGTLEERIDRLIEDKKATAHELLTHDPDQDPTPRALTELSDEELISLVSLNAETALTSA